MNGCFIKEFHAFLLQKIYFLNTYLVIIIMLWCVLGNTQIKD